MWDNLSSSCSDMMYRKILNSGADFRPSSPAASSSELKSSKKLPNCSALTGFGLLFSTLPLSEVGQHNMSSTGWRRNINDRQYQSTEQGSDCPRLPRVQNGSHL